MDGLALRARLLGMLLALGVAGTSAAQEPHWFERLKAEASDRALLRFLTAMPKGGDLHNHLTGSIHPEWFWELALAAEAQGYRYYTKVRIENCRYGTDEYGFDAYLLLFRTIPQAVHDSLDDCERREYLPLEALDDTQREAWLNALRLDKLHEGRAEFFEAHWARLGGMTSNPHLVADALVKNMQAFGAEGLRYLETQVPVAGFTAPDGTPIAPLDAIEIYRARLRRRDARDTGVTVRFQVSVLRFSPAAEAQLEGAYALVAQAPDFVAVNLVGREDDDKGYPLRFLDSFRRLRREYGDVRLSIHAGEVDEPNAHVRDTLLLGADRIGHGVNLITDPDTLLLMRHGPYLVETNLISNLLLEYVSDFGEHPFPEYLRTDIPVALSTDDRGMWDSTLTDEFFVAVREFDLTWAEVRTLSTNSIAHGFMEAPVKEALLADLEGALDRFERLAARRGVEAFSDVEPQYRGFLCRRYGVCAPAAAP